MFAAIRGDRWGHGRRISTIMISPFAKKGAIDSTPNDTTSILNLITPRFGLEPLPACDGDLTGTRDTKCLY